MLRGDLWWADLPEPVGSGPGYRRPVLIIQADAFNRSRIKTVLVAVVTKNLALAAAPGNLLLPAKQRGLPLDSVVNVSQLLTIDRTLLTEFIHHLPDMLLTLIDEGLRLVMNL